METGCHGGDTQEKPPIKMEVMATPMPEVATRGSDDILGGAGLGRGGYRLCYGQTN